jgi:O-antigen ligase
MRFKKTLIQFVWMLNTIVFTVDVGDLIGDRSVIIKGLLIMLTGLCAAYVVPMSWRVHGTMPHVKVMVAYLVFALLSSFWSSNPFMTLVFSLHLLVMLGLSVYSGRSGVDLIWPSCLGFGVVILASYIVLLVSPDYAIKLSDAKPRFGGLSHPNTLANIALVLWMFVHFQLRGRMLAGFLTSMICGLTIILAQSRTAFLLYILIVGIIFIFDIKNGYNNSRVRKKNVVAIYLPYTTIVVILIMVYNLGFLDVSGVRTEGISNLTGRLEIWGYYLAEMRNSLLLGGGFGSYTRDTVIDVGTITGAHNSFIEAASTLGVVGLMLYLAVFFSTVKFFVLSVGHVYHRLFGYALIAMFIVFSMLGTSFAGTFSWMHVLVFSLTSAAISRRQIFLRHSPDAFPRSIKKINPMK